MPKALRRIVCGWPLSIAVLNHDVAIYVYCEHCGDLVEEGEISPPIDETAVRLHVDQNRVRPYLEDDDAD